MAEPETKKRAPVTKTPTDDRDKKKKKKKKEEVGPMAASASAQTERGVVSAPRLISQEKIEKIRKDLCEYIRESMIGEIYGCLDELGVPNDYYGNKETIHEMFCAFCGSDFAIAEEVIELLVKCGIDFNRLAGVPNNAGIIISMSPLANACANGRDRTVKYLLFAGADPNILDEVQMTPLHRACAGLRVKVVKILLEFGVDVNRRSENGYTPLHVVCAADTGEIADERIESKQLDSDASPEEDYAMDTREDAAETPDAAAKRIYKARLEFRQLTIAAELVKHRADKHAHTDEVETPNDVAGDNRTLGEIVSVKSGDDENN
jgi:hypothetical protein